jgi:hypothetical protein
MERENAKFLEKFAGSMPAGGPIKFARAPCAQVAK